MDEERIKQTESGMLFFDLLILMRELVRAQLGFVADPRTGETTKNIASARHLIDMIEVVEKKTAGNLTAQEEQVLKNLLTELRLACVRAEERKDVSNEKEGD